jgi:hypothetical protein
MMSTVMVLFFSSLLGCEALLMPSRTALRHGALQMNVKDRVAPVGLDLDYQDFRYGVGSRGDRRQLGGLGETAFTGSAAMGGHPIKPVASRPMEPTRDASPSARAAPGSKPCFAEPYDPDVIRQRRVDTSGYYGRSAVGPLDRP